MVEGLANGCLRHFREWDSLITVPSKLRIEGDGPETRDLQAGWLALSGVEGFG